MWSAWLARVLVPASDIPDVIWSVTIFTGLDALLCEWVSTLKYFFNVQENASYWKQFFNVQENVFFFKNQ